MMWNWHTEWNNGVGDMTLHGMPWNQIAWIIIKWRDMHEKLNYTIWHGINERVSEIMNYLNEIKWNYHEITGNKWNWMTCDGMTWIRMKIKQSMIKWRREWHGMNIELTEVKWTKMAWTRNGMIWNELKSHDMNMNLMTWHEST